MTDEYTPTAQEIKSKQHRNLLILSGIAVMVGCGVYYFMDNSSLDETRRKKTEAALFSSPVNKADTQSVWMERAQNKFKDQERKTDELKREITEIKNNEGKKSIENDPKFLALQQQNQMLQESLKSREIKQKNGLQGSDSYSGQVFPSTPGARLNSIQSQNNNSAGDAIGIDNDEIQLKSISNVPKKNPDTYVSSGTFAEGIMLGAADASAGVQAQSNPSPMLFRIIADGTLPNHKKSHLKDCVVTAAVVGDISSERGQIRLERMSCTFPNGEIVEQPVEGTVFGMDAKNGVRGTPVWREGALLSRAAVAGTMSGLGSAITQTYTTNSISPLGTTQTVNNGDIFKAGVSQGVANGMEKLAEYNIKRAEQYHPVIQLTAGQPVDIVFLKGFYLDGRNHDESSDDKQASSPLFPTSTGQTATGLTLSDRELQRIKQNEKNMGWVSKNQSGGMQ